MFERVPSHAAIELVFCLLGWDERSAPERQAASACLASTFSCPMVQATTTLTSTAVSQGFGWSLA